MLKIIFITIILFVVIQHILDYSNENQNQNQNQDQDQDQYQNQSQKPYVNENNEEELVTQDYINENKIELPEIIKESNEANEMNLENFSNTNKNRIWTFDKPNPWSRIIEAPKDEYRYHFYLKLKIPSLNDYETWKQIIPNLEFIPKTGELIIPSKDEASALALANLISINFSGQMSIDNILKNKLIQISVSKSKAHKMIQKKFREQITENLNGNTFNNPSYGYHKDLANIDTCNNNNNNNNTNLNSENFSDTFEHFGVEKNINHENKVIEAYDGSDYTYI